MAVLWIDCILNMYIHVPTNEAYMGIKSQGVSFLSPIATKIYN